MSNSLPPLPQMAPIKIAILGTGLTASILSGALSRLAPSNISITHLDSQPTYGGLLLSNNNSALNPSSSSSSSCPSSVLNGVLSHISDPDLHSKLHRLLSQVLDPLPQLLLGRGRMVTLLAESGVGRYLEFKAIEQLALIDRDGTFQQVPSSKESVFSDPTLSLLDKRKIMKFMASVVATTTSSLEVEEDKIEATSHTTSSFISHLQSPQFNLTEAQCRLIIHSIALFPTTHQLSTSTSTRMGTTAIRTHLASIGRFSPKSAFLTNTYGLASELCQAFCRYSAVYGSTTFMLGCPVDRIVDNTTSGGGSCVPQYSVHLKQEKSGADSAADTVIDADIIIMAPSYYRHHQSPSTQNLKFTTVQYSRAIVITSTSSTTPPSLLEYQYITIHPTEDHPNGAQCLYHYVSSSGGEDIILRYFVSLSSTTTTTAQQDLEWAVKLAVSSVETVISQHYYTQSIEEINNGSDEWWGGQDGSLFILPELPPLTTTMNNTSRGASSNEEEEEVYNTGLEVIGGNVFDRAVGVARRLFDKICASSTLTTTVDDGSDSTPVSREFYPLFDYTAVDE